MFPAPASLVQVNSPYPPIFNLPKPRNPHISQDLKGIQEEEDAQYIVLKITSRGASIVECPERIDHYKENEEPEDLPLSFTLKEEEDFSFLNRSYNSGDLCAPLNLVIQGVHYSNLLPLLPEDKVHELEFFSSYLSSNEFRHIGDFANLEKLIFPAYLPQGASQTIGTLYNLRELRTSHCTIEPRYFNHLKSLTHLSITHSKLKEQQIEDICYLSQLKELNLSGSYISLRSAKNLAQLQHLKSLTLTDNRMSDASLLALTQGLPSLRHLNITGHYISEFMISDLKKYCREHKIELKHQASYQ